MYDAIVVGARCAGAPTAMLLARAGYRVLLLDRAGFPSDTLSTHLIHPPGVAALARWGLLDRVRASGCPALERAVYQVADVELSGCGRGVEGQRFGYSPRRHILDPILADGAVAAGVEFRDHCSVNRLLFDDSGRVVGVEGLHHGSRFVERARLVIGADGMRSTVGRLVGAEFVSRHPLLTCAYYSYFGDVPADFELYERPGSWVAAVPTNDAATLVLVYLPQQQFDRVRHNAETAYTEQIRHTAPGLFDRLHGQPRLERLRGTGQQQNFFRGPAGPGWALIGDAAHHKDSITARGISDAFWQAESLVEHLGDRLDDPRAVDERLTDYALDLQETLSDGYQATLSVARLEVHPRRLALLRAVQSDPDLTTTYFDVLAGAKPATALFRPRLPARSGAGTS